MLEVTSVRNPRVAALRALREASGRKAAGAFLVDGEKLCREALRDAAVETLLIEKDKLNQYAGLAAQADDVLVVTPEVLAAVSDAKTPQGIVAKVALPQPMQLDVAGARLLALSGVQDPGNVGAMARTAEAAGFSGLLLSPDCADPYSQKAMRASMGSLLRLPVCRAPLTESIPQLKAMGYAVITAELSGDPIGKRVSAEEDRLILVIGSEAHGVLPEVSALAGRRVRLQMEGQVESLNAAVAASILMYLL